GGRVSANIADPADIQLVATSEATSWTRIKAESLGPREGMKEMGSQLATITCPLPISTTYTSTPRLGPTSTFPDSRPLSWKTVLAITSKVGLPNCIAT